MKYFKTQNILADNLIDRIDKYWNLELDEISFINDVSQMIQYNSHLLYKNNNYSASIQHKLGKKRLILLDKIILLNISNNNYHD